MIPLALAVLTASLGAAIAAPDFDWTAIEPSWNLTYTPCFDKFECARLLVPLDWLDTENNTHTVAIAILKSAASVPEDDSTHGGPILLNPGGPGGSGVNFAKSWADRLRPYTESETKKFDFIGFDPRGVGATSPQADCFLNPWARQVFEFQKKAIGEMVPDRETLARRLALAHSFGELCEKDPLGEGSILGFSSTASVARDMVEIIDKIEERKQNEKNKMRRMEMAQIYQKPMGIDKEEEDEESEKSIPRLQYMGFSYGTVLGNTFASMFPGRIGRIILDGVCDIDDYMSGDWLKNLQDNQALIDLFFQTCFDSTTCPLKQDTDLAWNDIQTRVDHFISNLTLNPVPVLDGTSITYLEAEDLHLLFWVTLYSPQQQFPRLATIISEAMKGNYTGINPFPSPAFPDMGDLCPRNGTYSPFDPGFSLDGFAAIHCGDGKDDTGLTREDWALYIETLLSQSSYVGHRWAEIRTMCSNWQYRPKYRFTGPFTTPKADPSLKEGIPAAPILFAGSSLDPVTPIRNARAMSARHPGSVVLEQDSVGHCSIGLVPSECTRKIIQSYMVNGTMPEKGTVCKAECRPFEKCEGMKTFSGGREERMPMPPVLGTPEMEIAARRMWEM